MSVIIQSYQKKDNNFLAAEQAEKWASEKKDSEIVAEKLATCPTLHCKGQRIYACANTLILTENMDSETGEVRQYLYSNRLCHDRNCPLCQRIQKRRQRAAFHHAIPGILERHPNIGLIVLTLTIKNCPVTELRATIQAMNKAWPRLMKRKEFTKITGWVRITEITKGEDGTAHPHFHCLLMVPSWYLSGKRDYVTNADWREAWAEALGVSYLPEVHNGAMRPPLKDNIAKALNYITKSPQPDLQDDAWIIALAQQTHRQRLLSAGGALKGILNTGRKGKSTGTTGNDIKVFQWDKSVSGYKSGVQHT